MKYMGKYEFGGHALPGHILMNVHYAGRWDHYHKS